MYNSVDYSELVQIYSPTGSLMYSGKGTEISVESFASGMYIIHVEVEGVGEKVLKWFGVMRPVDLDTF